MARLIWSKNRSGSVHGNRIFPSEDCPCAVRENGGRQTGEQSALLILQPITNWLQSTELFRIDESRLSDGLT